MSNLIPKMFKSIVPGLLISLPLHAKIYDFTENNKLTLLQEARSAIELKLDLVKHAKHHIHIMTYYWDKEGFPIELMNELRKANERGVEVRIMTSYLPTLSMDFWGKAKKELFVDYDKKKSVTPLAYMNLVPGNNESFTNNIHEKIFLVDGDKAIIGGRNITDAAYRAKDLEVLLEGPVVGQVQSHFEKMFSFLVDLKMTGTICRFSTRCIKKYKELKYSEQNKKFYPEPLRYLDGVKARILTNEVLFDQYKNDYSGDEKLKVKDDIIDTIIKIDFTRMRAYNYYIIPTERYKNFLIKNLSEGKDIEIISNSYNSSATVSDKGYIYSLPEMYSLVDGGLNLYQWLGTKKVVDEDGLFYLHEKVMLFDDDHGIIGSHNFGVGSTSVSSEISIEFYSKAIVENLNNTFDSEIQNSELTKKATKFLLEEEMHDNRKVMRVLRTRIIRNLVRSLY